MQEFDRFVIGCIAGLLTLIFLKLNAILEELKKK